MRLIPILAMALLCSCSHQRASSGVDPLSGVAYSQFVGIAGIGGDLQLVSRLAQMFQKAGITAIVEGSVVYGISVAPANKAHAIELLREDAAAHKYWIQFSHQ